MRSRPGEWAFTLATACGSLLLEKMPTTQQIGLDTIFQYRMINVTESFCLISVARNVARTPPPVHKSSTFQNLRRVTEKRKVFRRQQTRWRQVTRCVGQEIALLPEYTKKINTRLALHRVRGPPLVDEEWHAICQAIFEGVEGAEWGTMCYKYQELHKAVQFEKSEEQEGKGALVSERSKGQRH